jgi:hypothetical protein
MRARQSHQPLSSRKTHVGPIDEHPESFIVRDATGQPLSYFYFDDEPRRRRISSFDSTADTG